MTIWTKVVDFIFGIRLIKVETARAAILEGLNTCDADKDGYINVRELLSAIKKIVYGVNDG